MNALVDRVRRRLFGNELLAQGVNAANAALTILILLLLLGTQVLEWYWAALIPALAAAAGIYLARRRMPGRYAVAQILDARMGLEDSLSTAVYFSQRENAGGSAEGVRRLQADRAEKLAASVDARKAAPFRMPRTVYLLAGLFLVAGGLFALRYGLSRTLDLKPPLARMIRQQFGWNQKKDLARNDRRNKPPQPNDPEDDAASKDPDQKGAAQPDAAANEQASTDPAAPQQRGGSSEDKKQADNTANAADEQEAQAEKSPDSANDPANSNGQSNKSESPQYGGKPNDNSSSDNSSWMNKLKDAFASLMPRPSPPRSGQGPDQGNQDKQKSQQNGGKPQQGKDGQQNADQQGDAQDGQSGENGQDQQQDPNGKSAAKNDSQQKSKQPGSGIGSQDGDKSIKQAQQLEAMGKLSEIYGKRAANITGEATVEVQATSQQLKTQYVQRGAQHSQTGSEIDRDVVPVSLQGYVEQYFEQLRKQSPPPAGKGTPSKTAAPAASTDKSQEDRKQ